jgi:hypothetical protein
MKIHFFKIIDFDRIQKPSLPFLLSFENKPFSVQVIKVDKNTITFRSEKGDFMAKTDVVLKEGEKILLNRMKSQQNFELEILERHYTSKITQNKIPKFKDLSIFLSLEKSLMNKNNSEFSKESLYQVLHSLFPFIDWDDQVEYFFWKDKLGEVEAFYKRAEKQKFFIKMDREKLGKVDFLLEWTDFHLKDLFVTARIYNEITYKKFLDNLTILEEAFKSNKIPFEFHLYFKQDVSQGWVA